MSLEISNISITEDPLKQNQCKKGVPFKESKPIDPIFKSSTFHCSFKYKNSKGQIVDVKDHYACQSYIGAMTILNKYFENGRIPISKKFDIMQDISVNFPAMKGGHSASLDVNSTLRDAVNDFTGEGSPGGTDITVEEVYLLYERFGAYFTRND